jgi:Tfp pilus assembly PilM family ATPase
MFLSKKSPLVAIDIGSSSIKLVQLTEFKEGQYELNHFGMVPLDKECVVEGAIKKPDQVVDALKNLIKAEKIQSRYVVSAVAGEAVFIKKIKIDERTDILQEAGLKPAIIDLDLFALMNAARLTNDLSSMGTIALIDLGDSFTHINIIQNGVIGYTRDIPVGGGYLTNMLMSKFKVPFERVLAIKRGNFSPDIKEEEVIETIVQAYKNILDEVQKYFDYFSTLSNHKMEKVLLCGGGSMIRGLDDYCADYLKIPVETLNPMQGVKVNPKVFDQSLVDEMSGLSTVALGLARRKFDYT